MAQINVTINGRSFRMACDDGEEDRLIGLAGRFDGWINELRGAFGEIGDQRLTVMAGIMATDQLAELERKVSRLEAELEKERAGRETVLEQHSSAETNVAQAIEDAASRIEALAQGLSKSLRSE
ncbi:MULTISPECIES: cell division protein ZapA [Stappiaceae]|uniref:cell division protein ZapA n=1 Tax=Stappiaceae TaxID=2821832 RepID=UPI00129BF1C1|nr:cell division protein ZapA [Labrenzia sp. CE80]